MGCWNKTCGLTNLHIIAGSEVYVFMLEAAVDKTERCYSTAFWSPLLLPFYSKYDDYGGGEESSGVALPYIVEGLRKKLTEMEQGDNEYHDIPIKRDAFDEKLLFEAVHENRLFTTDYHGEPRMVDFVMLRKDVVDYIIENRVIEKYVGAGGNTGYNNNYIEYKFADIVADIPEFLEKLGSGFEHTKVMQAAIAAAKEKGASEEEIAELEDSLYEIFASTRWDSVFEYGHSNKVAAWTRFDSYRFSSIVRVSEVVTALVRKGNIDEATQLLTDHLKAQFINGFMESTRKNWAPGGHEGSQSSERNEYFLLMNAMKQVLDVERAYYEDDSED